MRFGIEGNAADATIYCYVDDDPAERHGRVQVIRDGAGTKRDWIVLSAPACRKLARALLDAADFAEKKRQVIRDGAGTKRDWIVLSAPACRKLARALLDAADFAEKKR